MIPETWTCACGRSTTVSHYLLRDGVLVHDPDAAYRVATGLDEPEQPPHAVNEASR